MYIRKEGIIMSKEVWAIFATEVENGTMDYSDIIAFINEEWSCDDSEEM